MYKNAVKLELVGFDGKMTSVLGYILIKVGYQNKFKDNLKFFVAEKGARLLLGRDWIKQLNISVDSIFYVTERCSTNAQSVAELLKKNFASVFTEELGTFTAGKVSLHLKPNAIPVFCKPRSLPFALRDKVEQELDRLIKLRVLEPVEFSEWAGR